MTVLTAYTRRREAALTPLIHHALSDPARVLALRLGLRRGDGRIVREILLHLALDLRGEEAARIARLFRDLGLLDVETARLRSRLLRRRVAAAATLGILRVPGTFGALLPALADRHPQARIAAVRALGDLGTREALGAFIPILGDPNITVARQAQDILAERGQKVAREIRAYLRSPAANRRGRLAAVELLGWHKAPEAARQLLELIADADPEMRVKAVKAAALIGDPRFLEAFHGLTSIPPGRSAATPPAASGSSAAPIRGVPPAAPARPALVGPLPRGGGARRAGRRGEDRPGGGADRSRTPGPRDGPLHPGALGGPGPALRADAVSWPDWAWRSPSGTTS